MTARGPSGCTSRRRPRPPGNRCADHLLEVLGGRLEGLLERLADPTVGLLDQALELPHRGLQVGALRLELLDVGDGFGVLVLCQRVDRAELLAPAREALDARLEVGARLVAERCLGRLARRGLEAEPVEDLLQVVARLPGGVADLLSADLGAGDRFARRRAGASGRLLPRGRRSAARRPCARRPPGRPAARGSERRGARRPRSGRPRAHPRTRRATRSSSTSRSIRSRSRSIRAARSARSRSTCSASRCSARRSAATSARRTAAGPSSGALRRRLHQPLGCGGRPRRPPPRRARAARARAGGVVALGVGARDGLAGCAQGLADVALARRGRLGGGDELVAAVALLEHALLAAGGGLAQLAGRADQHAARLRRRDTAEAARQVVERLDQPGSAQQALGDRPAPCRSGGPGRAADGRPRPAVRRHRSGRRARSLRSARRAPSPVAPSSSALALAQVVDHAGAQERPERGRHGQLEARLDAQVLGQRAGAARRRRGARRNWFTAASSAPTAAASRRAASTARSASRRAARAASAARSAASTASRRCAVAPASCSTPLGGRVALAASSASSRSRRPSRSASSASSSRCSAATRVGGGRVGAGSRRRPPRAPRARRGGARRPRRAAGRRRGPAPGAARSARRPSGRRTALRRAPRARASARRTPPPPARGAPRRRPARPRRACCALARGVAACSASARSRPAAPTRSRRQLEARLERLALDPLVQLRGLGLALERAQARARLALDVERAGQVRLGALELQLGAAAALAVLAEPGGLLDQQPPVARLRVDDRLDLALRDDRVHLLAESGVAQRLDDVGEAAAGAVQAVLAVAGAVEPAHDRDLGELARQRRRRSCRGRPRPRRRCARRRPWPPAKITSCIVWPRTASGDCSPSAQSTASVTFDLPDPFGPTITDTPGVKSSLVRSGNDLKPLMRERAQVHPSPRLLVVHRVERPRGGLLLGGLLGLALAAADLLAAQPRRRPRTSGRAAGRPRSSIR